MNKLKTQQKKLTNAKVHFIGIGGIGMCGLAELLHNMGARVTGSDMQENAQIQRLREMGVQIFIGHAADQIGDAEVVVYSSAVKAHNEEYREARRRGVPLIPRAEALAEVMRLKRGVAVAGTHGKTTTTSMTASIFLHAKLDPTIVVGGRLDVIKSTAQLGHGEWLIAEADESDGSFNRLSPEIVIITNIDNDHLDYYKDFENLKNAFYDFASRVPFYGSVILCGDDSKIREVFADFPKRTLYYGFNADNDYVLEGARGQYRVRSQDGVLGELVVPLPGRHNALNALAAVLTGMAAGLEFDAAVDGVRQFRGVDRRFQKRGEAGGIFFYDDYGHHPTEVSAVLAAFKEGFPDRRLVVLFQPHRYSRTQLCWEQFLSCFKDANLLFVTDIYPAGEPVIQGIESPLLVEQMHHPSAKFISGETPEGLRQIQSQLQPQDVLVSLGAGSVWKMGDAIRALVEGKSRGK
ncbi:MAG: UDP-N-acetylmuramate--L-alanine ligase [Bdellovibrionales bacterium]|nr:UDP-N-acetylmuramate--L-alanine ligase [Bdellovibrionales bacterium]